jgi:hypothetical protein
MTYQGMQRAMRAAERRFERESQKRRRELERQAKEAAKLSALEQARLEVDTFENQLDVILSIHKEQCREWDWLAFASALRPPKPRRESPHEDAARLQKLIGGGPDRNGDSEAILNGRAADDQQHQAALAEHKAEIAEMESLRSLALRVLDGEGLAFLEAFAGFNPVAEFSSAGSLKQFAVEQKDLIDCVFKVNADGVIPTEVKSLTSTGKLSVKPMPKARFHEIYQDYVCGCTFRMAKEIFAMLPVETVILTALTDVLSVQTGHRSELPTVSLIVDRRGLSRIDFDQVSPADAIDLFRHRCNFKATRKAGAFQPVVPLTQSDVTRATGEKPGLEKLIELVRELREEIKPAMAVPIADETFATGDMS